MSNQGNGGNYPSTTSNPSGGGRGNGPRFCRYNKQGAETASQGMGMG